MAMSLCLKATELQDLKQSWNIRHSMFGIDADLINWRGWIFRGQCNQF